jgi:CubicO group peptidase (beta-lactamase class C family)
MRKWGVVISCGIALLIAAVVAVVVASRNRHQPAPPPDVPVVQTPAEVRVKAVERKVETVSGGEVAAASGAVAIVCGGRLPGQTWLPQ